MVPRPLLRRGGDRPVSHGRRISCRQQPSRVSRRQRADDIEYLRSFSSAWQAVDARPMRRLPTPHVSRRTAPRWSLRMTRTIMRTTRSPYPVSNPAAGLCPRRRVHIPSRVETTNNQSAQSRPRPGVTAPGWPTGPDREGDTSYPPMRRRYSRPGRARGRFASMGCQHMDDGTAGGAT